MTTAFAVRFVFMYRLQCSYAFRRLDEGHMDRVSPRKRELMLRAPQLAAFAEVGKRGRHVDVEFGAGSISHHVEACCMLTSNCTSHKFAVTTAVSSSGYFFFLQCACMHSPGNRPRHAPLSPCLVGR